MFRGCLGVGRGCCFDVVEQGGRRWFELSRGGFEGREFNNRKVR